MASKKYRLSNQAVLDLQEIARYIGERNTDAADRVIDELSNTFRLLALNPEIGTNLDDLRQGLRVFTPPHPAHNYAIFFRRTVDGVVISDVVHSARDWMSMITRGNR